MHSLLVLASLLTLTSAAQEYFSETCKDVLLGASTGILTATCNDKQQKPKAAALDLNKIIGVQTDPLSLIFTNPYNGPKPGFTPFCSGCVLTKKPHPIYGGPVTWMNCRCGSPSVTLESNLDENIGNDDGVLKSLFSDYKG
ncbi:Cyanovirin-N [Glarea lozoyensis ATCC 20868]|uniref:Cyanovirin-N n=1 Tax=Glarea lozoyensis (strain ATCC 20868 / MF5171) TaxID=1116229 RepID=S3DM46_GLAL2|nr:Cyanovirin-N [Glarea lozoyensis ATCC 20868]EPE33146.1 Cyanovirin-N [Glarea lozoyensis ATCC 20868]